jgi:hypothetical protein
MICSLETSCASKCARESNWTSCPDCGDPLHDIIQACTSRLLFYMEILPGVDNECENLDDMASVQGLNLVTKVQPGGMEAGLLCEHFFKTLMSPKTTVKSMRHTYWTFVTYFCMQVCKC